MWRYLRPSLSPGVVRDPDLHAGHDGQCPGLRLDRLADPAGASGALNPSRETGQFESADLSRRPAPLAASISPCRHLSTYIDKGIFERDPFVTLDQEGVGDLIRIATERGRAVRPDVKLGICGEHGGDPASIQFCESVGLDYVSCSPYRVPIARLAAAQAAIGEREKDR